MKHFMAIFLLFAVLMGTVTKDVYSYKAAKSIVMNDDESGQKDQNDDKDGGSESKDEIGKGPLESFLHEYAFTFRSYVIFTPMSFLSIHTFGFDAPYLESVSQPPEVRA